MMVVGGIGNVFFADDGFGPAVMAALSTDPPMSDVRLVDAGVRTMHLAYDLVEGVDLFIAVDAHDGDDPAGTLTVLQLDDGAPRTSADGHGMGLDQLLRLCRQLGPGPRRTLLVGCQPATLSDGVGLSPTVSAAVEPAAMLVRWHLAENRCRDLASTEVRDGRDRELGRRRTP